MELPRATRLLPSQAELLAMFEDIGYTVRRRSTGRAQTVLNKRTGYLQVRVAPGHTALVHRVLYKMRTGTEPPMVDHVDRDKLNNTQNNLRAADASTNQYNQKIHVDSSTRVKNVFFDRGKYRAAVRKHGKVHYGPRRTHIEEAARDAAALRERLAGQFASNGEV